jgi:hypothetical protein
VEQKPADKLYGTDGGLFYPVFFTVLIFETHHAIGKGCEARVGDSHPMSITGQVFEDVLRLVNGFAHTDDPVVSIELVFEGLVIKTDIEFGTANSP